MKENKTMSDTLLIQKLHIDGFGDKYKVDISFSPDVNILTGNNGVGKTTILDIIYSMFFPNPDSSSVRNKYRDAELFLSDNSRITIRRTENQQSEIQYFLQGNPVSFADFRFHIRCIGVSNFDTSLPNIDVIRKMQEENPNIQTELDMQLSRWISTYNQYMTSISRRIDTLLSQGVSDMAEITQLYQYSRQMESLCNELFKNSKVWDITEEGKIQFKLLNQDKVITPEQLSSGEKQLLTLLISTLVQNGLAFMVFWDEPEISLHIAWQQQLIRLLRTLNPNMQLIIATHSPNLLYEGWEQRVVNIKNCISDE